MMDAAATSMPRTLWLATAPPRAGDEPEEGGVASAKTTAALKVLIVEDEFFIALDTQAQVEALGHTVVGVAVSADQAVTAAEREEPDVVLMDIRLSGPSDGIDAAVEIRHRFGTECIFVTANTDPITLQRAESIHPLGVLRKPLTQSRLQEKLAYLRSRSGRH